MSQKLVYLLLKELGGTATNKQIAELAKKKYPNTSLYAYTYDRLQRLRNWGIVTRNKDGSWTITKDFE